MTFPVKGKREILTKRESRGERGFRSGRLAAHEVNSDEIGKKGSTESYPCRGVKRKGLIWDAASGNGQRAASGERRATICNTRGSPQGYLS